MPDKKSFNLVYSPWIFLVDGRRVSLKQLFEEEKPVELAGTPIERLEVFRLLLAIAHSACRLEDEEEWLDLDVEEMKASVIEYLEKWSSRFDLYDPERPFLQLRQVRDAETERKIPLMTFPMGTTSGNTTLLNQGNFQHPLEDAEKTYVLLQQNIFALSAKKGDQNFNLLDVKKYPNFKKPPTAPYSSAMGKEGYLHTYPLGKGLMQTLLLNLLSEEEIREIPFLRGGIGFPPWEKMPKHEKDDEMFATYLGWLLPFARFCLIDGDYLCMTSGIEYPPIETGQADLSVTVRQTSGKEAKFTAVCANLTKQPWREIEAFLSYLDDKGCTRCLQVEKTLARRVIRPDLNFSGLWCSGVQVSISAFNEQMFGANDGFVDSEFRLRRDDLNKTFLSRYQKQIKDLDKLADILKKCVFGYFRSVGADARIGKSHGDKAAAAFWECGNNLAERLLDACISNNLSEVRNKFAETVRQIFDESCPPGTGRQRLSWGKFRPNLSWYERPEK